MGIRNDPDLADWLFAYSEEMPKQRSWARSVALYYASHGFMTEAQHAAAVKLQQAVEENDSSPDP